MILFENYSFTYGKEAGESGIHNIDITINQGECVLLCGSSGCGKSTLLRSVNGIIPHLIPGISEGKVIVSGLEVQKTEMYELAKVTSSVFQNPKSQFFNTDVESEIVYSLENQGIDVNIIDNRLVKTVSELKLQDLTGRNMFELSGGEKQKIAFAGAYISDTPVILLDEPTANLDPDSITKIRNIIIKMKAKGKTILIAEHRISWLNGIADRVVYMRNGCIDNIMRGDDFFGISESKRIELGICELCSSSVSNNIHNGKSANKHLEASDLTLSYKSHIVQEKLNLYVNKGEILGITGVNGAGKTTLLRTLAGLSKQKSGVISLNGKKMNPKQRRKHFGMVTQDVNYQLFADSCENECMLGNPGITQESATDLLNEALLNDLNERHPQSLSGGQKQRLALAVCKASDKDILLLDEPTSGLDFASMIAVKETLKKLSSEDKTIIIVTHDTEFLQLVCDRIIRLEKH
ncbi:MAG: ABC transporter ATP-binding protein [Saccharofermentans sp.]|nr:ABC transporter ATP-binding protein [Saccharofermentans sp.]